MGVIVALAIAATGCSRAPSTPEDFPLPKGAVVVPLENKLGVWSHPFHGFWLAGGEPDAPLLQLIITDGHRYSTLPQHIALEMRCDPWARGMIFGSAAVRMIMEPPHPYPGDTLALTAGGATWSGPAHPRALGLTDTSIPGTFVPADAIDLKELARARTLTVRWGAREATLPAPPARTFADFASRCADAFQFGHRP